MASRNSKSSGSSRSPSASKSAKASARPSEMQSDRAKGSGGSSKRGSMVGEKKSLGSKSSK